MDHSEHVAATVFTGGCNFHCPFTGTALALKPESQPLMPKEDVFAHLRKRWGILEGICISGGEHLAGKYMDKVALHGVE